MLGRLVDGVPDDIVPVDPLSLLATPNGVITILVTVFPTGNAWVLIG